MLIIKIILSCLLSIILCKIFAFLEVLISLFVYSKIKGKDLSEDLLSSFNERSLLKATIIIYAFAAVLSTACMYGLLILFCVEFSLELSIAWLLIRWVITFFKFKNNWRELVDKKIGSLLNKK